MQRAALEKTWSQQLVSETETEVEVEETYMSAVSGIFIKGADFDLNFEALSDSEDEDVARAEWEGMGQWFVDDDEPFE